MIRISIFLLLCASHFIQAQSSNFQQEVSYNINVTLDTSSHYLNGSWAMNYTNHSNSDLKEIYIHLWANAFENNNTLYAKTMLSRGQKEFYFAKEEDFGGFENLDFTIDGNQVNSEWVDGEKDIIKLILARPLSSGDNITIKSPLHLNIPKMFSRLGHVGKYYHMTHWYPRVAVYDKNGWHPMHYLGMGEFYGEYATYDVSITTPSDFTIGHSGIPMTSTADGEAVWKVNATNMHDMAWVAAQDYIVDNASYPSTKGDEIQIEVLYREGVKPEWRKAIPTLIELLKYYERSIGPYPYDRLTVVQDLPMGKSNMEYPGLIIVGDIGTFRSMEYYLNHELGHQWFYGAIGFNERDEAWLDEGLTTYYEHRYTYEKYGIDHYTNQLPGVLSPGDNDPFIHTGIIHQSKREMDQAADTKVEELSMLNYGFRFYERAANAFQYLEEYLGQDAFDATMRDFYKTWRGKHPSTRDLQQAFVDAQVTRETIDDLDWFFNDVLISTKKMDFAISGFHNHHGEAHLHLKNKGAVEMPILLQGFKNDEVVYSKWLPPFEKDMDIKIDDPSNVDFFAIDHDNLLFDINRANNQIKTTGLFRKIEPLKINGPFGIDHSDRTDIYLTPAIGINSTDGIHLGFAAYNNAFPTKNLKYYVSPKFGFGSKNIVGSSSIKFNQYLASTKIRKVEYKLGGSRYSHFYSSTLDSTYVYHKLEPSVTFHFRSSPASRKYSKLRMRSVNILDGPMATMERWARVNEIKYSHWNFKALQPFNYSMAIEHQDYKNFDNAERYVKFIGIAESDFYYSKSKKINVRGFYSHHLLNTRRDHGGINNGLSRGSIELIGQGMSDYKMDEHFLNRDNQNIALFYTKQVSAYGGGFKSTINNANDGRATVGGSNNWALAVNLKLDQPFDISFLKPLQVFVDAGLYSAKEFLSDPAKNQLIYSSGLMLDFRVIKIHLPLFESSIISNGYPNENFGERIARRLSFSIHINDYHPWEMLDDFNF